MFLMFAKLRKLESVQWFVHLMHNLLETLVRVMEFMLLPGGAVWGIGQPLLLVRAPNALNRARAYRSRWPSWDLSRNGRTYHLNLAGYPSP